MTAAQMKERMQRDPDFVRKVNAIPANKYRAFPVDPSQPERWVDTLEVRAFEVAKKIRALLKEHGPEPSTEGYWEAVKPWRDRVNADFNVGLKTEVMTVRDELAERNVLRLGPK